MKKSNQTSAAILRQLAEEQFKERPARETVYSKAETIKLIHELEIHQIELEMQHEELLHAHAEARETADKYSELYDFAPSGYFTLSGDGEIMELNHCGAKMLGKKQAQLKRSLFGFFVSNETKPIFNQFLTRIYSSHGTETCEVTLCVNQNLQVNVHLSGTLAKDGESCLLTADDITDKLAAETLADSRYNYHLLFTNNPQPMVIYDLETLFFLEVNEAAIQHYGYSKDEFLSMTIRDIRPEEDLPALMQDIELTRNMPNAKGQWRHIKKNGDIIFVEINSQSLVFNGRSARHVLINDVTEKIIAGVKLQTSETLYRSILHASPDNITITDLAGSIRMASPVGVSMFGYERNEQLVNRNLIEFIAPSDREKAEFEINRMHQGVLSGPAEYKALQRDGSIIDIEANGELIRDTEGNPTGMVFVVRDVTERSRTEERLKNKTAILSNLIINLHEGILLEDAHRNIALTNQLFCDMFGIPVPPETMVGADCSGAAEQSKMFFKNPDRFIADINVVLTNQKAVFNDLLELADGRYFERDYIPTYLDNAYNGHLWKYRDITKRKLAEKALFESEVKYRNLVENINDVIYEIDNQGVIQYISPTIVRILGYTDVEITGRNSIEFVGVTADFLSKRLEDLAENLVLENEYKLQAKSGETRWVRLSTKARFKNGIYEGGSGTLIDITARKLAENQLVKSEERFRQVVEQSREVVWEVDAAGLYTYVSPLAFSVYGYTAEQMIGKLHFYDLHPKDQQEQFREAAFEVFRKKGNFSNLVGNMLKPDGSEAIIKTNGIPILDENGDLVGYRGVDVDYTWLKNAEDNLRKLSRAVEQSPVMIYITGITGIIEYVNDKVLALTGYTKEELLENNPRIFSSGETTSEEYAILYQTIKSGKEWKGEFHNKKKNGEFYWVSASISPIIDTNGKISHFLAIEEDITERKAAEKAIIDLNATLALTVDERTAQLTETNKTLQDEIKKSSRTANALAEAFDRLHKIADQVPGVVYQFRLRPDGTSSFPYASEGIREIYQVSPETVANDGSAVFSKIHPEDRNGVVASISASALDLTPWRHEYRVKFEDGTVHWVSGSAMPQREADGSVLWHGFITNITDRKQAEEDLKQVSTRLALAARIGGVGVWDFDLINNVLIWDDQMFALYGTTKDKFSGAYEAWQEGLHPDDRVQGDLEIQMALRGEKEFDTEFRVLWPDGTVRNIRALAVVQRDSSGKAEHLVGTNWDITRQKDLETLLDQTRRNYETFFNTIDDFLFVLDEQGNIIHTNETVLSRLGYSMDELMSQSVLMVHPPERRDEAGRIVGEMLAGTADFCPVPLVNKSGGHIPVETRVKPGFWDGKPVIFGVSKDISKIKLSEEKFSKAFHFNSALMAISDFEDGRYIDVNDTFLKTLGYNRNEVLSKTSAELEILADTGAREMIIEKLKSNNSVKEIEIVVVKKNGSHITGLFSADSVYIGKDLCLLTMMVDITERKQAEAEIIRARNEAEKANHAKSEFISRMSHELRTPMNSILGFAQLMGMGELIPSHRKGVNHILNSGKHLLNLINEVLDISRIEAGRLTLALEHVQLNAIISEMVDVVHPYAMQRLQTLEFDDSQAIEFSVMADRQRLRQVLLNLINNAVKYNREGGSVIIKTALNPGVAPRLPMVRISIIDNGLGIKPEDIEKLFHPFERIGAEKTGTEGTGLGLTLVKELMEAMGGHTGVESIPGEGSTFWVELPMAESQQTGAEGIKDASKTGTGAIEKTGTILHIEDNIPNAELIEGIIGSQRPSIRLITTMYGELALDFAIDYQPDLILLDLDLPDLHGTQVLANLLAEPLTRSIPVVIISADAIPEKIEMLKNAGARDYLAKPIDITVFLNLVDRLIDKDNL
ncbi:MAG: PAS domain S-box protein [Bacteroidetes bacterium]|nr:PAS domain S-box protein [Bacteroidota bacterium]